MGIFENIKNAEIEKTPAPLPAKVWSRQQQEIFEWFRTGKGSLIVRARAGTGKTTTIIEALKHAPETSILLCAFNRRIADELVLRCQGTRAQAKTLHGVGYACIGNYWRNCKVDNDRGERLARAAYGELTSGGDEDKARAAANKMPFDLMRLVRDLSDKGKEILPVGATEEALEDLAVQFDLVPEDGSIFTTNQVAQYALRAMQLSATTNDGTVTFSDMLFLPLINGWAHGRYDLVIVDECQDMNAAQILLAQRVLKKGGRLVAVGDDKQAIYGFRGADSGSLDRIKQQYEATELGLTITYRCGSSIVAEAQMYVPDFYAAPTAHKGLVRSGSVEEMMANAAPGDFVLSRLNAPMVKIVMRWLREGRKAKIEGKDIGKGLLSLIRKQKARSMDHLFSKLSIWRKNELERAESLSKKSTIEARKQYVNDQVDTIVALASGLSDVRSLEGNIDKLFSDNDHANSIVLSTVHKAKGLEADRVWILESTFCFNGEEESNIRYVACTRAKNELVYVQGDTRDQNDE